MMGGNLFEFFLYYIELDYFVKKKNLLQIAFTITVQSEYMNGLVARVDLT